MSLPQSEVDKIREEAEKESYLNHGTGWELDSEFRYWNYGYIAALTKEREKANAELQAERDRVKELVEALRKIAAGSRELLLSDKISEMRGVAAEALSNHSNNQNKEG